MRPSYRMTRRDRGIGRWLPITAGSGRMQGMSTLMEIEQAAVKLPAGEQHGCCVSACVVPVKETELPGLAFSPTKKSRAAREDEASMRRFREGDEIVH